MKSRARIGLVALYFDMFDDIMPPSFRQEKEAVGREIATMLGQLCEVDYPGIIANEAKAVEAADRWGQAGLDAIIFFPTMASPPSFSWAVARASKLPLLIWNGHLIQEIHDSFTYHDANRYSSNVGTIMVTNVFLREGRTFTSSAATTAIGMSSNRYDDTSMRWLRRIGCVMRGSAASVARSRGMPT